jgi:hypothetical protein
MLSKTTSPASGTNVFGTMGFCRRSPVPASFFTSTRPPKEVSIQLHQICGRPHFCLAPKSQKSIYIDTDRVNHGIDIVRRHRIHLRRIQDIAPRGMRDMRAAGAVAALAATAARSFCCPAAEIPESNSSAVSNIQSQRVFLYFT